MPSSLIFAGLVVLWLLILVPAVARRRQEVARLSPAVLSGRVLERPTRHRLPEVDMTERRDDGGATTVGELAESRDDLPAPRATRERDDAWDHAEIDDHGDVGDRVEDRADEDRADEDRADEDRADEDRDDLDRDEPDDRDDDRDDVDWERPAARYRPGRGGYDPEAAAAAAHAKYAFRQRLVLVLLVLLLVAGVLALLVSTVFWWAAGAVGLGLTGYLTYLRRQVRIEESIRDRRAARLAGTHRTAVADDPDLDDWARRGRDAGSVADGGDDDRREAAEDAAVEDDENEDWTADDGHDDRIRGTGEPIGVLPARCRTVDGPENTEHTSSLPRITSVPPPPIPAGTALVDVDDDDEIDAAVAVREHRRAVGE